MNMKINWAVCAQALPAALRACPGCRAATSRHRPSGRFRVNANGKLLDVWLLVLCEGCGRTSKIPVHERVHVNSLPSALRLGYQEDDQRLVRELMTSASFARKASFRLDWAGTWRLESDTPFFTLDDPPPADGSPVQVLVHFELPAPIRLEALLMQGLHASQWRIVRESIAGRLIVPRRLSAKVHADFTFQIAAPVDPARRTEGGPGPGTR